MSPINNFFTWLILPGRIIGVIIPATDLTSMTQNKSSELPNSCLVWPWRGVNNEKISLKEIIITRKFTLIYLGISYLLILLLGFASTRNCTETWQLALYCKYSFWASNFTDAPLIFIRNLFTYMFFHNSLVHIGFVTFGMLLVVQAYEVRCGFKKTVFTFFLAYFLMGPVFAIINNIGIYLWPTSEFFGFVFERSWIGGSLGFYFVGGTLIFYGKRPFLHLCIPIGFEIFNHIVVGIDTQITFIHLVSTLGGVLTKLLFDYMNKVLSAKPDSLKPRMNRT